MVFGPDRVWQLYYDLELRPDWNRRPVAVVPKLPKEIILNTIQAPNDEARATLAPLEMPFIISSIPVEALGGGHQSNYHAGQIHRMANGPWPVDALF